MIRILHTYSGASTKERPIEPGDYAADDPALFGLANYLVKNGHAVAFDFGVDYVLPPAPPKDEAPVFMTSVTIDEHGNPVKGKTRPVTDKDLHPELWASLTALKDGDRDTEDAESDPAKEPAPPSKSDKPKRK